jgi:hypothetical protein
MSMSALSLKTPIDSEIDRGLSFLKWKELQRYAVKGFNEKLELTFDERDASILRVDYSIIDDLLPGDSLYIHPRYGVAQARAAAFSKAKKHGWAVMTRKDYENDIPGIRVFRIA